jgi:hypothetical protein
VEFWWQRKSETRWGGNVRLGWCAAAKAPRKRYSRAMFEICVCCGRNEKEGRSAVGVRSLAPPVEKKYWCRESLSWLLRLETRPIVGEAMLRRHAGDGDSRTNKRSECDGIPPPCCYCPDRQGQTGVMSTVLVSCRAVILLRVRAQVPG